MQWNIGWLILQMQWNTGWLILQMQWNIGWLILQNAAKYWLIDITNAVPFSSAATGDKLLYWSCSQWWVLNTSIYLNTKCMAILYLNTKYSFEMYLNTKYNKWN